MGNIPNSLPSEMIIIGVVLKLGMILNLMKIQRWSKLGNALADLGGVHGHVPPTGNPGSATAMVLKLETVTKMLQSIMLELDRLEGWQAVSLSFQETSIWPQDKHYVTCHCIVCYH